jgi:hypothetical protein
MTERITEYATENGTCIDVHAIPDDSDRLEYWARIWLDKPITLGPYKRRGQALAYALEHMKD